jgi:nucleoid DNA-binding protein
MLKRRKLKWAYYLVLVIILAVTIWANIRLYFINSVSCYSGVAGGCSDLLSYKIAEYLAYISLIILGVYIVYMYFVSEGKKYVQEEQADSPVDNKDYMYVCYEDEKMSLVEEEPKTSLSEVEASDGDSLEDIEEQNNVKQTEDIPQVIETETYVFDDSDDFDDDYDNEFDEDEQDEVSLQTEIISEKSSESMNESGVILASKSKKVSKPKDNSVYKKDIVKNIRKNTNLSNYKAKMCLNIMLEEISSTLMKGEIAGIEGLGTFKKLKVEEHKKVNPKTNKEVTIEEHNRIQYKPDVLFIGSLNNSKLDDSKKNVEKEKQSTQVVENATVGSDQVVDKSLIVPSPKIKKVSKPVDNSVYKKDIAKNIQKEAKITNYKATLCLNVLVEAITDTLKNGENVDIEGLGLFKVHRVLEHQKVDAIKKEQITIEAHGRITYKPDKAFTASLNEKKK